MAGGLLTIGTIGWDPSNPGLLHIKNRAPTFPEGMTVLWVPVSGTGRL